MIIQFTRYKSSLSEDEVARIMKERAVRFLEVPGLIQKYYVRDPKTGENGGIYIWESEEAMQAFGQTELAQGMADAYKIEGEKRLELFEIIHILRN